MNNQEIERKMNFIVEQQAQFASDIQLLQESQARTEQVVSQTAAAVAQSAQSVDVVVDVVTRLANVSHAAFIETHAGFTETNAKIKALVDAQIRTEENLARFEANLAHTDQNLNNLIGVVDRYLSGNNGT